VSDPGFRTADAVHVAAAEAQHAGVLLTCDDRFLKAAKRLKARLTVAVQNPVRWLQAVTGRRSERNGRNAQRRMTSVAPCLKRIALELGGVEANLNLMGSWNSYLKKRQMPMADINTAQYLKLAAMILKSPGNSPRGRGG
ncbi:MAG TPA: hypothetical protein VG722_03005, partial [Tepidisphaeraceae bacterium]|nr:hypothetical protein [Tepidisphaeraceae bacterium]